MRKRRKTNLAEQKKDAMRERERGGRGLRRRWLLYSLFFFQYSIRCGAMRFKDGRLNMFGNTLKVGFFKFIIKINNFFLIFILNKNK